MRLGSSLRSWPPIIRGLQSRVRTRWGYVLVLVPFLTDLLDTGHLPLRPRDLSTELLLGVLLGVFIHILYREADQLRTIADTDQLTGLWNRRKFDTDVPAEVTRAQRLHARLSLAYMDLDNFKAVNDTFGHHEGDAVLRDIGRLLLGSVRQHVDRCYRVGGDEFAIMLLGARAEDAVHALCSARSGRRAGTTTEQRHQTTCSIGVVELRPDETPESFVRRADRLMYAAKSGQPPAQGDPDALFAKC